MNVHENLGIVILAAGKGTRMKSATQKVLHRVAHYPLVCHVIAAAKALSPQKIVVVLGADGAPIEAEVRKYHPDVTFAIQREALGTGHAVLSAEAEFTGFDGTILMLCGDAPLITPQSLSGLLGTIPEHAVSVLAMDVAEPGSYGRVVLNAMGYVGKIVEAKEATDAEKQITLCNTGVIAAQSTVLWRLLKKITNHNAKGEFYLTDLLHLAGEEGNLCGHAVGDEREFMGINTRVELAAAEAAWQERTRKTFMTEGVTLTAPETVYFSFDTALGQDVTIHPHVVFGPGVVVEGNVEIRSFTHLEGCILGSGSVVGPFARIRPGTELGESVHVGNFVEIKNSQIASGAKVNHLSYIGDADVGIRTNVGAGTITCNYDGFHKHRTTIGAEAFIGSNTALVAPVRVGDGAIIGAGSTITRDVEAGALALTRAEQADFPDKARQIRERKRKKG